VCELPKLNAGWLPVVSVKNVDSVARVCGGEDLGYGKGGGGAGGGGGQGGGARGVEVGVSAKA